MKFKLMLFLALSIFGSGEVLAQSASLSGSVQDTNGAAVPNVAVSIRSLETGATRAATTDTQGNYSVSGLPAGTYEIRATREGFKVALRPSVELLVGQNALVNFTLEVGAITESVTTTAEPPLMETGTGATSAVVVQKQIEDLPLNGRSLIDLTFLSAGVSRYTLNNKTSGLQSKGPLLSINGARPKANAFFLDGTLLNDGLNQTPGSVSGNLLGVDAVREFRVLTNAYSAQYGAAGGGALVAITRTGTNKYHGSGFEFLRNDNFDARNFFDQGPAPKFRRNQFGGSIGGPIVRDRTFTFGQYEALREVLGTTQVAILPSASAHSGPVDPLIKPFLDAMPIPPGGTTLFPFSFNQVTRENYFNARLDHKINERDNVFGRYTFDDASLLLPRPAPGFHNAVASRNQYLTLQWDRVQTANFLNSFRFSFVRTNMLSNSVADISLPSGAEVVPGRGFPQIAVAGFTTFGPDRALPKRPLQNSYQFTYDVAYNRGKHEIKAGFFLDRIQNNLLNTNSESGDLIVNSLSDFLQNKGLGIRFGGDPRSRRQFSFRQTLLHSYFEDTMKVSRKLTVILGLRYEPATQIKDKFGNVAFMVDPVQDAAPSIGNAPFINPTKRKLAPRVGFSWSPFEKTVVRGGYGIFYDLLGTYLFNRYLLSSPVFFLFQVSNSKLPFAPTVTGAPTFTFFQYRLDNPNVQQWNLSVQREIRGNLAVTLGYTGSKGTHLITQVDANPNTPQVRPDGTLFFPATIKRRNPLINSPIDLITSDANSWYHGLQLVAAKRFSSHFSFNASYVFSRFIDEKSSQGGADDTGGFDLFSQMNPFNRHADKGLSAYHMKHNFVLNYIVDLPFGRNLNGIRRTLLAGWQIQGITTLHSGLPFTPFVSANRARLGSSPVVTPYQRPNLNPGFTASSITGGPPNQFYNPTAFSLPEQGTFGNLGRNVLIGPSFAVSDFSVIKKFRPRILGEAGAIQFRAEVFNIFNRANFSLPQQIVFSGTQPTEAPLATAGRITSTSSPSRQIQFGLKIIF